MLFENTKKNVDIISSLEEAGVMPTVETDGPYYPQLVRKFICNMIENIDDPVSPNFQKETFQNFTFDFSPCLINGCFARANGGETGYNLQLFEIFKVLTGGAVNTWPVKGQIPSSRLSVKYAILHKVAVVNWVPTTPTTSVSKTMARVLYMETHVADMPLRAVETGGGSRAGNDETVQFIRNEIKHLEGMIRTSLARKSVLEARLMSLAREDDPVVDLVASDSEA
ncbi:hypothetical protein LIER_19605 [Lithospermum erythrorhizon]|uniref:Envelope-like protein n=1 Tax=Lithospermum erythrorhizon TaxID=34254 RepID=A0AAV3QKN6_LITER